jgi:hypothetical protein
MIRKEGGLSGGRLLRRDSGWMGEGEVDLKQRRDKIPE